MTREGDSNAPERIWLTYTGLSQNDGRFWDESISTDGTPYVSLAHAEAMVADLRRMLVAADGYLRDAHGLTPQHRIRRRIARVLAGEADPA